MKYPFKNSGKILGKNIAMIIVAILLIGGSFIFAEHRNKQAASVYVAPEVTSIDSNIDNSAQALDNDKDGVPDWEEILLGSNPYDAKSKPSKTSSSTSLVKDLTKTNSQITPIDTVSREFFSRYMELRQLGLSNDKASQKELVQKTIDSIPLIQAKAYTLLEIITKPDDSKESIKNYGNEMTLVFKKNIISSRNEAIIVRDAIKNHNPETIKELDPVIESYRVMVNEFLKIKVPESMANLHLELVNAINSTLFMMKLFRQSTVDPLAGVQALSQYIPIQNKFFNAVRAIQNYIISLGITYAPSEPAYFFVHPK